LECLSNALTSEGAKVSTLGEFYYGYKIPQIGKEFDLLRFDSESIINIEIKRDSTIEKIEKQLIRNRYYLSFTGKRIINFTYISSSNSLFMLSPDNSIVNVEMELLIDFLRVLDCQKIDNIDNLFDPSEYLVSPFNSTERFLESKYFLTHQQEEIREKILRKISSECPSGDLLNRMSRL
jgi:hypothetical protein